MALLASFIRVVAIVQIACSPGFYAPAHPCQGLHPKKM